MTRDGVLTRVYAASAGQVDSKAPVPQARRGLAWVQRWSYTLVKTQSVGVGEPGAESVWCSVSVGESGAVSQCQRALY